ncbi:MAG TPA: hypothetical protein VMZ71_15760, partial [Gemmataceae bacterium]|nr:hypothetical protein [Gemmataceae bacterium]
MDVPLRLARRESAADADAVLLCAQEYDAIAAACAQIGGAKLPEVFAVRGGFLLVPRDAMAKTPPGAVRLRRLTGDLFVPVDAELLPALLPEESTAMTSDRGLVVLPGGEILAFDPDTPLTTDEWLTPGRVRAGEWRPFPKLPPRPDHLTTIERPAPPAEVLIILSGGQPDAANRLPGPGASGSVPDDARPPSGAAVDRVREGMRLGTGRFLAWLGRQLRSERLARAGGDMARRALERLPRLSERVLGEQEAALREVLRQLQSGDVERGLRHAPIAVADPNAPRGAFGTNANLGSRDPWYSLRSLLGAGAGGGMAWLGGGDVWAELAREYRRLAAEAQAAGDFRRAAYLHGVLLRDLRSAANALMAGGFFRDAGVLFRDRLKDEAAAANAFEQAGDYDEALRLYDKLGFFENAGRLLRQLGDDDRADDYFVRAAEVHATHGRWLTAAELIRASVGDLEKSQSYYRRGWDAEGTEAVACGMRLFDEFLAAGEFDPLIELWGEGEERFAPPRMTDAGRFINHTITAAKLPENLRADLTDRARMLFASHMRSPSGARAADVGAELFGRGAWSAPVVRDAAFATRVVPRKSPANAPALEPSIKLVAGPVTAVAVAREAGDVFVAGSGDFVRWCVGGGRVVRVGPFHSQEVVGIATDPTGEAMYSLHRDGDHVTLRCSRHNPTEYEYRSQHSFGGSSEWALHPPSKRDGEFRVWVTALGRRFRYDGWHMRENSLTTIVEDPQRTHLLLGPDPDDFWDWADTTVRYHPITPEDCQFVVPWQPRVPSGSSLLAKPIDWVTPLTGVLEVAGLDAVGNVYWSEFDGRDPMNPKSRTAIASHPDSYRAVCIVASGLIAAVTAKNEIHWLRVTIGNVCVRWSNPRLLPFPSRAVALLSRPQSNEVI